MAGLESFTVQRWVYSLLSGDAALTALLGNEDRIFRNSAPASAKLPYIVFSVITGTDVNTLSGDRVMQTLVLVMRVIGSSVLATDIEPIFTRMDTLMAGKRNAVVGSYGNMFSCVRETTNDITEPDPSVGGLTYQILSANYRVYAQNF